MESTEWKIQKIGIGMAAYQPDPTYFAEQLESITQQTFRNWTCIITFDSPIEGLRSDHRLKKFFEDQRFVWVENKARLGHLKNFERAIQLCLGEQVDAIACSDQDDVWYPNKLERCAELLSKHRLGLVHCDMHSMVMTEDKNKILPDSVWTIENRGIHNSKQRHLLVRNIVAGAAMVFDAELARRYPVIPDEALYHDHWYALAASHHGGVWALNEPLFAYRQHGQNEVGVTPFVGTFTLPDQTSPGKIVTKSKIGWLKSRRLAQAALREGLPISKLDQAIFCARWDMGAGLLLLGASHYFDDRPLTRACFARTIGKFSSLLKPESALRPSE